MARTNRKALALLALTAAACGAKSEVGIVDGGVTVVNGDGATGEADPGSPEPAASIDVDAQLKAFAELGIELADGVTNEDLAGLIDPEDLASEPYRTVAVAISHGLERPPWTAIADRIWMCDYECIEGPGSYADIVERLEAMTGGALGLANIDDRVTSEDVDGKDEAWVGFDYGTIKVKWEFEVDDDWLDPTVIVKYDELLRDSRSDVRIHVVSPQTEFGQAALFGAFTAPQAKRFTELTGIEMVSLD